MTRSLLAVVVLCTSLELPAVAQGVGESPLVRAESLLKNLQTGTAAAVVAELDASLAAALPESKLQAVWPGLLTQFGAFKSIVERRAGMMEGRQAVELFLQFEKDTIVMRTVFDAERKIAGLVFRPRSLAVLPAGQQAVPR